ncbi:hypothetical protein ACFLZW_01430 [Chloroflexota bacterium]
MYNPVEPDPDKKWIHTVIVDKIDGDTCNGNNVSVAAHANDRYQHPLSEYGAFLWYPVEMKGYFDFKRVAFLPLVLNPSVSLTEIRTQNPYPAPEVIDNSIVVISTPDPYPVP